MQVGVRGLGDVNGMVVDWWGPVCLTGACTDALEQLTGQTGASLTTHLTRAVGTGTGTLGSVSSASGTQPMAWDHGNPTSGPLHAHI